MTSAAHLIRVSTSRTGERRTVRVHIYDDADTMRAGSEAWNGAPVPHALGVTQYAYRDEHGNAGTINVRLAREHLTHVIIAHELLHAASLLYRSTLDTRDSLYDVLDVANETFAHIHSDLYQSLLKTLTSHGYTIR